MFAAATTQDCESEYLIDAFLLWCQAVSVL